MATTVEQTLGTSDWCMRGSIHSGLDLFRANAEPDWLIRAVGGVQWRMLSMMARNDNSSDGARSPVNLDHA